MIVEVIESALTGLGLDEAQAERARELIAVPWIAFPVSPRSLPRVYVSPDPPIGRADSTAGTRKQVPF